MKIKEIEVYNVYYCTNKECEGEFGCVEKVADPWQKTCPFCKTDDALILKSGTANFTFLKDIENPKTFGGISDKNKVRMEREGSLEKQKRPFWRDGKINYKILKDPKKYIETGKT